MTDTNQYQDHTVDELQDFLRERELPVSGTKDELIERLEDDDKEEAKASKSERTKADKAEAKPTPNQAAEAKAVKAALEEDEKAKFDSDPQHEKAKARDDQAVIWRAEDEVAREANQAEREKARKDHPCEASDTVDPGSPVPEEHQHPYNCPRCGAIVELGKGDVIPKHEDARVTNPLAEV